MKLANIKRYDALWLSVVTIGAAVAFTYGGSVAKADPDVDLNGNVAIANDNVSAPNVAVTLTMPGETTVLAGPINTDENGSYDMHVAPGVYDVHFTPPAGSLLKPDTEQSVAMLDDINLNVTMTYPMHTVSGVVTDAQGNPQGNVEVDFGVQRSSYTVTTVADNAGNYTAQVPAGVYAVGLSYSNGDYYYVAGTDTPQGTASYWLDVTQGDVSRNLALPATSNLTVRVLDSNGNSLSNTTVSYNGTAQHQQVYNGGFLDATERDNPKTAADGTVHLSLFNDILFNPGDLCVTQNITKTRVCNAHPVSAQDGSYTITEPAIYTYAGTLLDHSGSPMPHMEVELVHIVNGQIVGSDQGGVYPSSGLATDSNGQFSALVNPGDYGIIFSVGGNQAWSFTPNLSDSNQTVRTPFHVSGDTNTTFTAPATAHLFISLAEPNGNAANNVIVSSNQETGPILSGGSLAYDGTVDFYETRSGGAQETIFDGTTFPIGSICATFVYSNSNVSNSQGTAKLCNQSPISINGTTTISFTDPGQYVLSGTITHSDGTPYNSSINLQSVTADGTDGTAYSFVQTSTDENGHFSVLVPATKFRLSLALDNHGEDVLVSSPIDVIQSNVTHNLQLPPSQSLTVTVKDENGNPMTGIQVGFIGIAGDANYFNVVSPFTTGGSEGFSADLVGGDTTDQNGQVNLPLVQGVTIYGSDAGTGLEGLHAYFEDGTALAYPTTFVMNTDKSVVLQKTSPVPATPTGLAAVATPTKTTPVLNWNAADRATSYDVYRDGTKIGSAASTTYTDTPVTNGTHGYYVKAVNAAGASDPSNTVRVVYDTIAPTVSTFTLTTKTSVQTENFTVSTTDSLSGVASGEFFYGTDPGQGSGTAMTYSAGALHGTLPTTLPVGVYPISVRAKDAAGNWSTVQNAKLVVTQAGVTSISASSTYTPSVANGDQLPSLTSAYKSAQYSLNTSFTAAGISGSSADTLTYTYGSSVLCVLLPTLSGCHQMKVTVTSFATLVFSGTNNGQAAIIGTATVVVDGVTTTNPITITAVDGARAGGADHYQLKIYNPSNPVAVLYIANNAGTVQRN